MCPWEDREEFIIDILGDGSQFSIRERTAYPGHPGAFAVDVKSIRFGKQQEVVLLQPEDDLASYDDFAKLTFNYKELIDATREDLPEVDGILTYSTSGSAEMITKSGNGLLWDRNGAAPVPEGAAGVQRIPITEHHLTWHLVLDPPWTAIQNQIGTLNDAVFLDFEAETMLFDSYSASKEFAIAADFASPALYWKLEYVFKSKRFLGQLGKYEGEEDFDRPADLIGWQHTYRGVPVRLAGWDELVDVLGNKIYETSNLNTLFIASNA